MKKVILSACLLLLLASLVAAEGVKYQIYSERTGFLGMGGKRTIMLNNETGNSWVYDDGRWVAIPKAEDQLKAEQDKSRFEDEISDLKAKQAADLEQLKAKQEAEIQSLMGKKEEPKVVEVKTDVVRPRTNWRRATKSRTVTAAKSKPAEGAGAESEEGAPAWLSE